MYSPVRIIEHDIRDGCIKVVYDYDGRFTHSRKQFDRCSKRQASDKLYFSGSLIKLGSRFKVKIDTTKLPAFVEPVIKFSSYSGTAYAYMRRFYPATRHSVELYNKLYPDAQP